MDVILHVGKNRIYCHELILVTASEVFKKTFTVEMEEKKSKEAYYEDIDVNTLKLLVTFMYTDEIPDDKITLELVAAADRFEVLRLKEICERKLSQNLGMENIADVFHIANLHSLEYLSQNVLIFMAQNWKTLRNDESIEALLQKYPNIL